MDLVDVQQHVVSWNLSLLRQCKCWNSSTAVCNTRVLPWCRLMNGVHVSC